MLKVTVMAAFLIAVMEMVAADYFVATNGIDNAANLSSQSVSTPVKTLGYVITNAILRGGDTVYIRGGTYDEKVRFTTNDCGSAASGYLTIKSYQNENVAFTWTGKLTEAAWTLWQENSDPEGWVQYIKIDGAGMDNGVHFRITANFKAYAAVKMAKARHIWLNHLELDSAYQQYVLYILANMMDSSHPGQTNDHSGSRFNLIDHCNIHNGDDYGIKITGWETMFNTVQYCNIYSNGWGFSHGSSRLGGNISGSFYDNTTVSNTFIGCNIYSNALGGLNFVSTSGNVVSNCAFYGNGLVGEGGEGIGFGTCSYNNVAAYCSAYNNLLYGIHTSLSTNTIIHHCTLWGNGNYQVEIANDCLNTALVNCTIYSTNYSPIWLSGTSKATTITNCIVTVTKNQTLVDASLGATITGMDYNCFYATVSPSNPLYLYYNNTSYRIADARLKFGWDVNSTMANPLFTTAGVDFGLQEASPCLNSGVNIGFPFQGSAPNRGAWDATPLTIPIAPPKPQNLRISQN